MARARTELVHCDNCGEDYAATYRRCPFCGAKPGQRIDDYDDTDYDEYDDSDRRGGKRLAGGSSMGDPARIAIYALAALVILAVICILISVIIPKLVSPAPANPDADVSASVEPSEEASAAPSDDLSGVEPSADTGDEPTYSFHPLPVIDGMNTDDPLALDNPDLPPVEPDPISSQAPVSGAPASPSPATPTPATGTSSGSLKLSSTDFTLSPRYPTYHMETGLGRAQTTYSVKDESVATVSSTGLVTAVGNGTTTLTVTDQSGNTATAIVRVSGMSGQSGQSSASEPPASQAPASGSAKLTYGGRAIDDFSITAQNPDPITLKVQGGTASSWSVKNTSVATVSSGGTVSAVGNGTTTVECTLTDGTVLKCTVRVSGM